MASQHHERPGGGFTVRRRFPATAKRIYDAFVEPQKLEHWFVVPGYRTPASRMQISAQTGGQMNAVMVSDADGSEIPFSFEYAALEAPHRVQLRFQNPDELVTVTLTDEAAGGVDLTYDFVRWPAPSNEEKARRGVEDMLDRIEHGIHQGVI